MSELATTPITDPITSDEIRAKIEALTIFRDRCIRNLDYNHPGMFGKLTQDLAALERLKSFVEYDALCEAQEKAGVTEMRVPPGGNTWTGTPWTPGHGTLE